MSGPRYETTVVRHSTVPGRTGTGVRIRVPESKYDHKERISSRIRVDLGFLLSIRLVKHGRHLFMVDPSPRYFSTPTDGRDTRDAGDCEGPDHTETTPNTRTPRRETLGKSSRPPGDNLEDPLLCHTVYRTTVSHECTRSAPLTYP